jgi:hypothetical protein
MRRACGRAGRCRAVNARAILTRTTATHPGPVEALQTETSKMIDAVEKVKHIAESLE